MLIFWHSHVEPWKNDDNFNHPDQSTTRTPTFWGSPAAASWLPILLSHIGSQLKRRESQFTNLKNLPKFQIFEFWNKLYMRHTFWSCLIRCANMKWIPQVLSKIQSGHVSVHKQTDGRTDRRGETNIPPFNFVEAGGMIIVSLFITPLKIQTSLWRCQFKTSVSYNHHMMCTLMWALSKVWLLRAMGLMQKATILEDCCYIKTLLQNRNLTVFY